MQESPQQPVLRSILVMNATFSLIIGVFLTVVSNFMAMQFGNIAPVWVMAFGIGLMLFGIAVYAVSRAINISNTVIKLISALDLSYVVGALGLTAIYHAKLSQVGIIFLAITALVVLYFSVSQIRQITKSD